MVQVAIEVLPFAREERLLGLDLGVGTGYFVQRFLETYAAADVVAVDGASAMIELAQQRLGPLADRVRFVVGDFADLQSVVGDIEPRDVIFSSYALHHLSKADKARVIGKAASMLRPGGWFVNADLITNHSEALEERFQALRVEGIVRRAAGADARFTDVETTRRFVADLQANEADQPLTLPEDLQILRDAGLDADVLWLEYREAVTGGVKK
jgi:ubiquinone/menaquinone biosynthesis C-methylase UbiE